MTVYLKVKNLDLKRGKGCGGVLSFPQNIVKSALCIYLENKNPNINFMAFDFGAKCHKLNSWYQLVPGKTPGQEYVKLEDH